MEDIIVMDPEQTEYEQIDVYDPSLIDKQDLENIEKIEKAEEENLNEFKQIDKSNDIVFIGDDINNLNSIKSINLNEFDEHFDKVLLWENSNTSNSFAEQTITFSGDDYMETYDYLEIIYNYSTNNYSRHVMIIDPSEIPLQGTAGTIPILGAYTGSQTINRPFYRPTNSLDATQKQLHFYSAVNRNTGGVNNSTSIPYQIYGLKFKDNVDIDPTPTLSPSVSGNNVINNYYITVSSNDASLSYNILNKPLNNYSVSESILLFIFMGLFVAGFSWFIKKNIFKL